MQLRLVPVFIKEFKLWRGVIVVGALLAAAAPVWGANPNPLDLLCKHKGNAIVAALCELRERVAALEKKPSVPGPRGPQGDKGPKGDPGAKGETGEAGPALTVKQSNGEVIGLLVDMGEDINGPYRVWDRKSRKILSIELPEGGVLFPEIRSVFIYESTDCSGPPLKDTPLSPYYIYRLEGANPYGWTHVEISDHSKLKQDVMIRSQWEGNPEICMQRNDVVGRVSELSPITPSSFTGPITIVEE